MNTVERGPLRIGFAAWRDLAHPQAGGSEVLLDRLARGCLVRGHDVRLMCGGPVGGRPYPVEDLGGEFTQYLRAPIAYARKMRDRDVLVDVSNGIPFFAPLWRRRPVVCLVHHIHAAQWRLRFAPPVSSVGWALERRGVPLVYRRARFIAVSPSTAVGLEGLGIPGERISIVHNGAEPPAGPPLPESETPLFLALGRLVPHKRLDLLIRMWEWVRPQVGGRLVIAGDGPERERLQALAGPGVELLGAVSDAERDRLLQEAWVLVHPALHEGWGIVVIEAGAAGTPALGFDVPGVRDAIVADRTGVLVKDEDAFAAGWIRLAGDATERRRLGDESRNRAADFTWERSVDRFLDVLRLAIEPASEPAVPVGDGALA